MAGITPTQTVNPQTLVANWTAALQSSANQQKLLNKYLNPKAAFNANPAQSQAAYATGVQRAIAANKYANGMANANLAAAAQNMQQNGITNWANSGTSKAYKLAAVAPALAAAINTVSQTVNNMPKGKGANNQARMNAWFTGMSSYYGKIKA